MQFNQAIEAVVDKMRQAEDRYHRLVLVVGPAGAGKTRVLESVSERIAAPLVNVSLELSRQMLELPAAQRDSRARRLLESCVENRGDGADAVLLDNTELLFEASLRQDPLRLLQGLSRNKTVVSAWTGAFEGDALLYATLGHPECRRYANEGFLAVNLQAGGQAW